MTTVKLRAIGDSVRVILPKEMLVKLGVGAAGMLEAVEQPDGDPLLTPLNQTSGSDSRRSVAK